MESKIFSELTRWERRWFNAAVENSMMSKDPSTQVGAVIVDPTGRRRISEGYNGFPQKVKDNKERLSDRDFKYGVTIHAEMNAILFSKCDLTNHHIYTTHPPCICCCNSIIQVGITKVSWIAPSLNYFDRWKDSCLFGRALFEEANVEMMEYDNGSRDRY